MKKLSLFMVSLLLVSIPFILQAGNNEEGWLCRAELSDAYLFDQNGNRNPGAFKDGQFYIYMIAKKIKLIDLRKNIFIAHDAFVMFCPKDEKSTNFHYIKYELDLVDRWSSIDTIALTIGRKKHKGNVTDYYYHTYYYYRLETGEFKLVKAEIS